MQHTKTAQHYVAQHHTMLLRHDNEKYVMRVRDCIDEEKPRERLQNLGPGALTVQELLAIVLGVGTKKEEVMTMASRVIREYGDRGIVEQKDPAMLSTELDIPHGKACQIVAAFELGRRFFHAPERGFVTLRTAHDVYAYVADLRTAPKEQLRGLYLNSRYQLIHDEVISLGTLTENVVHPREVFRPALEFSAAAVILVHNHPSGSPEPTASDIATTEQIVAAGKLLGIEVLDHVVVADKGFATVPAAYK